MVRYKAIRLKRLEVINTYAGLFFLKSIAMFEKINYLPHDTKNSSVEPDGSRGALFAYDTSIGRGMFDMMLMGVLSDLSRDVFVSIYNTNNNYLQGLYGRPSAKGCVVAGGTNARQELPTFDYDAILIYEKEGHTDGGPEGVISNKEYYDRLAVLTSENLAGMGREFNSMFQNTCFSSLANRLKQRSDMPRAMSINELKDELVRDNKNAYKRAIPFSDIVRIAGDAKLANSFIDTAQQDIFRENVLIEALAELYSDIKSDKEYQEDKTINIKQHPGGLRTFHRLLWFIALYERLLVIRGEGLRQPIGSLQRTRNSSERFFPRRSMYFVTAPIHFMVKEKIADELGKYFHYLLHLRFLLDLRYARNEKNLPQDKKALESLAIAMSYDDDKSGGKLASDLLTEDIKRAFKRVHGLCSNTIEDILRPNEKRFLAALSKFNRKPELLTKQELLKTAERLRQREREELEDSLKLTAEKLGSKQVESAKNDLTEELIQKGRDPFLAGLWADRTIAEGFVPDGSGEAKGAAGGEGVANMAGVSKTMPPQTAAAQGIGDSRRVPEKPQRKKRVIRDPSRYDAVISEHFFSPKYELFLDELWRSLGNDGKRSANEVLSDIRRTFNRRSRHDFQAVKIGTSQELHEFYESALEKYIAKHGEYFFTPPEYDRSYEDFCSSLKDAVYNLFQRGGDYGALIIRVQVDNDGFGRFLFILLDRGDGFVTKDNVHAKIHEAVLPGVGLGKRHSMGYGLTYMNQQGALSITAIDKARGRPIMYSWKSWWQEEHILKIRPPVDNGTEIIFYNYTKFKKDKRSTGDGFASAGGEARGTAAGSNMNGTAASAEGVAAEQDSQAVKEAHEQIWMRRVDGERLKRIIEAIEAADGRATLTDIVRYLGYKKEKVNAETIFGKGVDYRKLLEEINLRQISGGRLLLEIIYARTKIRQDMIIAELEAMQGRASSEELALLEKRLKIRKDAKRYLRFPAENPAKGINNVTNSINFEALNYNRQLRDKPPLMALIHPRTKFSQDLVLVSLEELGGWATIGQLEAYSGTGNLYPVVDSMDWDAINQWRRKEGLFPIEVLFPTGGLKWGNLDLKRRLKKIYASPDMREEMSRWIAVFKEACGTEKAKLLAYDNAFRGVALPFLHSCLYDNEDYKSIQRNMFDRTKWESVFQAAIETIISFASEKDMSSRDLRSGYFRYAVPRAINVSRNVLNPAGIKSSIEDHVEFIGEMEQAQMLFRANLEKAYEQFFNDKKNGILVETIYKADPEENVEQAAERFKSSGANDLLRKSISPSSTSVTGAAAHANSGSTVTVGDRVLVEGLPVEIKGEARRSLKKLLGYDV